MEPYDIIMTSYLAGTFYDASEMSVNHIGKEMKEKHRENKVGIIIKENKAKCGPFLIRFL